MTRADGRRPASEVSKGPLWIYWGVFGVLVVLLVVAYFALRWVLGNLSPQDQYGGALTPLGAAAAAIVAVLGVVLTLQHHHRTLMEENQANWRAHTREVERARWDRFTGATGQLGDAQSFARRLAGVYALVAVIDEWLQDETNPDAPVVPAVETLTAYLRANTHRAPVSTASGHDLKGIGYDDYVRDAIIERLREKFLVPARCPEEPGYIGLKTQPAQRWNGKSPTLSLGDADLTNVLWAGMDLTHAKLDYCDLCNADLRRADLRGAGLKRAYLLRAHLQGAEMGAPTAVGGKPGQPRLSTGGGARAQSACLSGADLSDAHLQYACLRDADFTNYNPGALPTETQEHIKATGHELLGKAAAVTKLNGADFTGADLRGAVFNFDPDDAKTSLAELKLTLTGAYVKGIVIQTPTHRIPLVRSEDHLSKTFFGNLLPVVKWDSPDDACSACDG
ncbi:MULTISPECIES: pentapeptide repeat-containing protein [unclassified Gordonia (in: high G+C Gram-positive bacteria)]|uniref:pentapeptide repeat-containing protein n=1 Tax=unclassified Gordonia (in: high G+C Gram-positive bacteria) TaxID=2657482 RepID=UPI0019625797|nr:MULTISPECIES: pentapeptide repeat-containing protein [unclassified Gordonia (in: high G+C Gram-positive bacteria)]MBN0975086.1 pentapeptide repeat-containing protein [Gordonia sp. BP-119]MBN0985259.1 pentapeptide repeat-containing protein [Gordonia sp. BP-94]